jgi:hypothetical protein
MQHHESGGPDGEMATDGCLSGSSQGGQSGTANSKELNDIKMHCGPAADSKPPLSLHLAILDLESDTIASFHLP